MRSRALLLTLLFIGILVLFAIPIGFTVLRSQKPPFSPPDEVRAWSAGNWDRTFDPGSRLPLPTLVSSPVPVLDVQLQGPSLDTEPEEGLDPTILSISSSAGAAPDNQDLFHEIFEASPELEARLPTGNRLSLEAVALTLPEDGDWSESKYPRVKPTWLDPLTLTPLSPEQVPGSDPMALVRGAGPTLFFRIHHEGGLPLRWHASDLFDERTQVDLSHSSSYSSHSQHGIFSVTLNAWHQTPVRIACNLAFGEPEIKTMPVERDASLTFGSQAEVRLVEVLPYGWNSRGMSSNHDGTRWSSRSRFTVSHRPNRSPESGLVFSIWPDPAASMLDIRATGSNSYHGVWGNDGIAGVRFHGESSSPAEIEVRYLPRLGRVVFRLPALPRLPESDNLFETPITHLRLDRDYELHHFVQQSASLNWTSGRPSVDSSHFPLIYENTTPAEVLLEYEQRSGTKIYFDRDDLTLTSTPPEGLWQKLKRWWQRSKPSWLP